MSRLIDLPTELVAIIGSLLQASDIGSPHLLIKRFLEKISNSFQLLFKQVKVSLISTSLQELRDAVWSSDIGNKIEHLIIGTETLERYLLAPTSLPDILCAMLDIEGTGGGLRTWLQNIIIQHLPNLRTVTIEDRAENRASEVYCASMRSAELMRTMGIDLS
jgi:hypothetical protein